MTISSGDYVVTMVDADGEAVALGCDEVTGATDDLVTPYITADGYSVPLKVTKALDINDLIMPVITADDEIGAANLGSNAVDYTFSIPEFLLLPYSTDYPKSETTDYLEINLSTDITVTSGEPICKMIYYLGVDGSGDSLPFTYTSVSSYNIYSLISPLYQWRANTDYAFGAGQGFDLIFTFAAITSAFNPLTDGYSDIVDTSNTTSFSINVLSNISENTTPIGPALTEDLMTWSIQQGITTTIYGISVTVSTYRTNVGGGAYDITQESGNYIKFKKTPAGGVYGAAP